MTRTDSASTRRPGADGCVAFAALWVALAVWFLSSGQAWPGAGAGLLAAAGLITAMRRRADRSRSIPEIPPTTRS